MTTTNVVPGDSITRAVDLSNDGTTTLPSVTLTASATGTPSILTTDPANGLQLSLRACSVAWTQGGTAAAPSHACPGTERGLYSGPPAGDSIANADPASLNPGGLDHLVFSVSLPTSANNAFQGKSAGLSLTFTAAQRAAADR